MESIKEALKQVINLLENTIENFDENNISDLNYSKKAIELLNAGCECDSYNGFDCGCAQRYSLLKEASHELLYYSKQNLPMENKKYSLVDRMKEFYQNRTRNFLPRRTYTIIRVDGKSFHSYTRDLVRPFDVKLVNDMDETACYMCKNIQGAKFAFVQSDEISILLTDFEGLTTDAWFDGNIQKMASISASLATAKFNELRPNKIALFDSRVFTIPSDIEVENYFIWRQQDTTRNSISSVAQSMFSHRELKNKNTDQMQEMCFQKGVNWNDFSAKLKRGRLIVKQDYEKDGATRSEWVSVESLIFTQEREMLKFLFYKTGVIFFIFHQ